MWIVKGILLCVLLLVVGFLFAMGALFGGLMASEKLPTKFVASLTSAVGEV